MEKAAAEEEEEEEGVSPFSPFFSARTQFPAQKSLICTVPEVFQGNFKGEPATAMAAVTISPRANSLAIERMREMDEQVDMKFILPQIKMWFSKFFRIFIGPIATDVHEAEAGDSDRKNREWLLSFSEVRKRCVFLFSPPPPKKMSPARHRPPGARPELDHRDLGRAAKEVDGLRPLDTGRDDSSQGCDFFRKRETPCHFPQQKFFLSFSDAVRHVQLCSPGAGAPSAEPKHQGGQGQSSEQKIFFLAFPENYFSFSL